MNRLNRRIFAVTFSLVLFNLLPTPALQEVASAEEGFVTCSTCTDVRWGSGSGQIGHEVANNCCMPGTENCMKSWGPHSMQEYPCAVDHWGGICMNP